MSGINQTLLSGEVARGVLKGDRRCVEQAYRVLSQPVMNMASRILNDRAAAEEVLQDTFIDLVEKAQQIKSQDAIAPWVRRVATNHCLMRLRSPWHARRVGLFDDSSGEALAEPEPAGEVPADRYANVQTITMALAELKAETRAVVWLHDVEGYTHREIADLMGKTVSFSKSQLARGYEKLVAWHEAQERSHEGSLGGPQAGSEHESENEVSVGRRRPTCAT